MITLRPATVADADLLFKWRNEPETVASCESGRPVTRDEHDRWLVDVLAQPEKWCLFIAESSLVYTDGACVPVGMGRMERTGPRSAALSYAVAREFQGHGFGADIIGHLVTRAHLLGYRSVQAKARLANTPSLRALLSQGFTFSPVEILTLEREVQP